MLNRCPVISADSEGAKEIITDTINGFLYRKGDINQLSELIQKIVTNNINTKCITETAYMETREKYSVKRYVAEVSNVIRGLLQN
jgi:glycosyltransferase involved in cell wall biosynthesis